MTYRKLNVMTYLKHHQLVVSLDFVLEANQPQLPPSWFLKYPTTQLAIKYKEPSLFAAVSDKSHDFQRLSKQMHG